MKKRKLSPGAVIGLIVVGLLFFAVLGYLVLISPQRSEAARLDEEIAEMERRIDESRALSLQAGNAERVRVADLFRLSKAMPDQADMPGVLLELNRIATDTGIRFDSVSPQVSVPAEGYQTVPIQLVFQGNFYDLADFLYRLRNLVGVRSGELAATGRLFAVETLTFEEGERKFPQIRATLTVNAYVFGTGVPATSPPPPAAGGATTGETDTTGTTTGPTETTPQADPSTPPAPPAGATAAGA